MAPTTDGAPRGAVRLSPTPAQLAERYAGVVLDLDGVVYLLEEPVAGAADAVAALRTAGIAVVFATNNAERSPDEVAAKLRGMGIDAAASDVVTSALAAAELLAPGTRCLVVGTDALRDALADAGAFEVRYPDDADAVLVGFTRELVWEDLRRATVALARGARFVGTNADVSLPVADGIWPGNGAVLAALTAATGRQPEIAGKPRRPLFDAAARRLPEGPLLMVGDRLETDIAGAAAVGWDTLLVLSGVTDRGRAERAEPGPTYVVESLADLARAREPIHRPSS